MEHLEKNVVTNNMPKVSKIYNTNFATAFYSFAFMFLFVYSLSSLSSILTPIAIAILIWFLINGFANFIKKIPFFKSTLVDSLAIPISLILIVGIIFMMGNFLTSSMLELSSSTSQIDIKLNNLIEKLSQKTSYNIMDPIKQFLAQFSLGTLIKKVILAFTNIFGNIMQILLYVLFLLIDQKYFDAKINAIFLNFETRQKAQEVLFSISKTISMYLSITTLISALTGVLTYAICISLGLKGAVFWGFIAFILNFIPTIGSIVAVIVPTLYSLIQFTDMFYVGILIICLSVVQFVVGNILYPKMMGDRLNISQFVVILSLVIWGAMWGAVGMFLSVPLMMVVLIILSQFENTKALAILISGNGKISD